MKLYLLIGLVLVGACSGGQAKHAQELVRHDMLDPDTAQFRELAVINKGVCVIGEVNGKNRFGAYTGYRPFVVDTRSGKVAIMPDDPGSVTGSVAEKYAIESARVAVLKMDCGVT